MILIRQCRLPLSYGEADLKKKAAKLLRIPEEEIGEARVVRESLDARKKQEIHYVCDIAVSVPSEEKILHRKKLPEEISLWKEDDYSFPKAACAPSEGERPVVIGAGPAGLFCAYVLAKAGMSPLLIERGEPVEERTRKVEAFWAGGELDPDCNVQFGEGGAGAFSDGKLTTLIKDKEHRGRLVLDTFITHGADENIRFQNKPHIGTDVLKNVVAEMRKTILSLGGEMAFNTRVTDLQIQEKSGEKRLLGLTVLDLKTGEEKNIACRQAVLAPGHSARDTFLMLKDHGIPMERKPFAVGVRMEHPQSLINRHQYGDAAEKLPPADYKVTARTSKGRGVYSFCMCPGGYVVNASSEPGRLAVNGMSYHDRGGANANSAVIVTVTPEDFPGDDVLSGVRFQREMEEKAFQAANGLIPVQSYASFSGKGEGKMISPCIKGGFRECDLKAILPDFVSEALQEGIELIDRKFHGFALPEAALSAVESRTSSPVRILRGEDGQSAVTGLYPCGEGAGYAGGIMSAAIDGIRTAELLVEQWNSNRK